MERNEVLDKLARGLDKWPSKKDAAIDLPSSLCFECKWTLIVAQSEWVVEIVTGYGFVSEDSWRAKRIELGLEKKMEEVVSESKSDGLTASYYELPAGCTDLQDLISHRNLNAQDGEMFRAIYRKGRASHSDELRDAKKVLFYAQAEVARLEKLIFGR